MKLGELVREPTPYVIREINIGIGRIKPLSVGAHDICRTNLPIRCYARKIRFSMNSSKRSGEDSNISKVSGSL